jgi:glycosyltransferase involved in cell wall biosynthesis
VDAWVVAIRSLLADPALGRRLGENAARAYTEGYSPEVRVARILEGLTQPVRPND